MLDVGPHRGRAPVAQWIEHLTTDQKVGGSSPSGRAGRRPGTVTVPGLSRICRRPADIRALTSVLPTPAAVAVELGEEGLGGGELGSQLLAAGGGGRADGRQLLGEILAARRRRAGLQLGDDVEHLAHLLERVLQRLHLLDELEPGDVVVSVETEAALRPARRADEVDLAVVADGALGQAGALGDLADLHVLGHGVLSSWVMPDSTERAAGRVGEQGHIPSTLPLR